VPLIQIPTTLLAQVDSSIGGKVAIDHGKIKNKIGAFYQPKLVIADIATLKTLSAEEVSNGLAEVIKYAVIRDEQFFDYLEQNLDKIMSLDAEVLEKIVSESARIKGEVVEKDEMDLGIRHILNLGHTVGHAIESASDFSIRHGQGVALGMLAAGKIANKLDMFSKGELSRLKSLIEKADLPTEIPHLDMQEVMEAVRQDKKTVEGKIQVVLPRAIGDVSIFEISPSLIEQVLLN
jgi:3-dehydroquinate synthase